MPGQGLSPNMFEFLRRGGWWFNGDILLDRRPRQVNLKSLFAHADRPSTNTNAEVLEFLACA